MVCRPLPSANSSRHLLQDTDRVNYSIGLHNHTVGFIGAGGIAKATLKGMLDKGKRCRQKRPATQYTLHMLPGLSAHGFYYYFI